MYLAVKDTEGANKNMLQWQKSEAKEINKNYTCWGKIHFKTTTVFSKYINAYEENIEKITKMLLGLNGFHKFVE